MLFDKKLYCIYFPLFLGFPAQYKYNFNRLRSWIIQFSCILLNSLLWEIFCELFDRLRTVNILFNLDMFSLRMPFYAILVLSYKYF